MSETPWTPGPWEIRTKTGGACFVRNASVEHAFANARLIAAAPELAEALETLLDAAITFDNIISAENEAVYQSAIEYARAALAKAKGETA